MSKVHVTLKELADMIGADLRGNPDHVITGIKTLQLAEPTDLSFLGNPVYRKYLPDTKAGVVILAPKYVASCSTNALVVDDPYFAYAKITQLFVHKSTVTPGVHPAAVVGEGCDIHPSASIGPRAVIADDVSIDEGTVVGSGVSIGAGVQIGKGCKIDANVTICHEVVIGHQVILHAGAVIGSDGFGMAEKNGVWHKIPQLGRVILEDDVEVGANTTIDRGALGDTVIEKGVKLDNQIQIAHNVRIGAHTAVAACTGIAGSTRIGKHCKIAGGVGINGHLELADYTVITGMAMVTNSVKVPGIYSSGTGILPNHEWKKNVARFRQLDKVLRRVSGLYQESKAQVKTNKKAGVPYEAFEAKRTPVMKEKLMGIDEVFKHLPHRPPFLLIDRVAKFTPNESLTALKNVTINEAFFQGHFPAKPIMPGVLILEALAQACTVFAFLTTGEDPSAGGLYYFAGIDKARFKRPVEPGDQLILDVEFIKARQGVWKMKGIASVADEVVCTAELLSAKPSGDEAK